MSSTVIVVPIYNETPKYYESVSLRQCFRIFKNRPLILVHPKGFNYSSYELLIREQNVTNTSFLGFEKAFFYNVEGYNKLLMNHFFYEQFINYPYLLIYQTDCYVFEDNLDYWCKLNYDYIGAPWLLNVRSWLNYPGAFPFEIKWFYKLLPFVKLSRVGNGGLSLRKTQSMISNLKRFDFWRRRWRSNEDNFFSQCITLLNPSFKVPDVEKAVAFSFDANPQECYKLNGNKLPMACHAFNRNDGAYFGNKTFWSLFIKELKEYDS